MLQPIRSSGPERLPQKDFIFHVGESTYQLNRLDGCHFPASISLFSLAALSPSTVSQDGERNDSLSLPWIAVSAASPERGNMRLIRLRICGHARK